MTVTFDIVRVDQEGRQKHVRTTQSAREARELCDTGPDEMLVVVHDNVAPAEKRRERAVDATVDVEGDFPI